METRRLKVGVIGPKGQCGSCVVEELLSRGHTVTGISRNPPKTWNSELPGTYEPLTADLNDTAGFTKALSGGFDAIVCAYGPPLENLETVYLKGVEAHCRIKEALLASDHKGVFLIIGGAGSLHNKDGVCFSDEEEFVYAQWYKWPDQHLNYMSVRALDHGNLGFQRFIRAFWWARNNVEKPGLFSWILRPVARLVLWKAKKELTTHACTGLIIASRVALRMWEGVRDKKWSFLSPPWLLRDKGVRTGKYEVYEDTVKTPAYQALEGGIYNEDMAVAIADEVENENYAYKHWSCTGPIDLRQW